MNLENDVSGLLIIGGIVLAGGLLEIYAALKNRRLAEQSRTWPRVQGEVIYRNIKRSFLQGFGQSVPQVRYSFETGGQRWEHDHIIFGGHRAMKRAHAEAIVARYLIGAKVTVIHDPNDPRICALESDSAYVTPIVYGVSMLLAGGIVVLAALRGI